MQVKKNTIKIKVIGWFILAALAVLLTGIISYNSYTELLGSLDNSESQEKKLTELGNTLADITEAEAKMRAYSVTRDAVQLDEYQVLANEISVNLQHVKTMEPVSQEFNTKIETVAGLLTQQIEGITSFVALKDNISGSNFSAKALDEISNSGDSLPAVRTTTTTTTKTTTVESLSLPEETDKKKRTTKRQQRKRAQEIAKELAKLEQLPTVQTETVVTTDTSFIQPDTAYASIQQMLENLDAEESYYQQLLAEKELQLIESSILIINEVRGLIGGLEKQELAINIQKANTAKLIASRSTLTISIIIFICLVVGIVFTYFIFKDVRISDYYNQQLIGAKNQAEQLAEVKQQFLANMSHEIRTPLNSIIGFTEQLTETELQSNQKEYLNAINSSSQHLLSTVNDILDYSKIEAGELKIESKPFDLNQCLNEAIEALQLKASKKGLDLILHVEPRTAIHLMGDSFRLKQILFNLISNGIKFTEEGYVKVEVRHKLKADQVLVELSVIDSGIGIPEHKREEVFHDFKQADATTNRPYDGTGLGLAICKKLVEIQGGTITLFPNTPCGSKFKVRLHYPISETKLIKQTPKKVITASTLANIRILAVDDDPFNLQLLQTILEKQEAQVTYSSNGYEAIELIKNEWFDIILTDINMPEVGGVELCRFVRSIPGQPNKHQIPIIALTANVINSDLERYRLAGINDFVLKPFSSNELLTKIQEALPTPKPDNSNAVQFALDDFKQFSAGDKEALRPMLEAFHKNLKQNLQILRDSARDGNLDAVAEVAHKMISSFGHVHASRPVNQLRILENKIRKSENDIPAKRICK